MSRRYGQVWRTLWRDQRFKGCSDSAQLVYLALLSGPCATALPGLVEADALILASVRGKPPAEMQAALEELVRRGLIEVDPDNSLIAVVDEPSMDEPVKSYKVLQGWWSLWQQLPASPLKWRWIARLRAACDLTVQGKPATDKYDAIPGMAEAWEATFGTARPAPDRATDTLTDTLPDRVSDTPPHTPPIPASASASASACSNSVEEIAARSAPGTHGALPGFDEGNEEKANRKAQKKPTAPTQAASDALEAAAGVERYTSTPVGQYAGNIAKLLATYGIEDFAVLGAYLLAGGDAFPADKDPSWLGSTKGAAAMKRAVAWDKDGRPAITAGRTNGTSVRDHRRGVAPVGDFSGMQSGEVKL